MSKDDKRDAQLQSDLPDKGEEFARRRKVIRGMASIPVAFTLSSGAALANTSNHQCLSNEVNTIPDTACGDITSGDPKKVSGWANSALPIKPGINDKNGIAFPEKHCVAYATEYSPPNGKYLPTGYIYEHTYVHDNKTENYSIFINANGGLDTSSTGNPLRASCATSFAN